MASSARAQLGVAIGATRVVAVDLRRRDAAAWRRAIEPPADDGEWPSLAEALRELRELHPSTDEGELSIALLPPLAQVRPVALPPLAPAELRRLVARNAAKYFLGARGPQAVGLAVMPRAARDAAAGDAAAGDAATVIAAVVDARRLDAIEGAAARAGWRVRAVVPAEAAWRAAAVAGWPDLDAGAAQVGVVHDDRIDVLALHDGYLVGVRRFGVGGGAVEVDSQTAGGVLPLLGAPAARDALPDALREALRDVRVQPPATPRLRDADAAELAAAFASRGAGLELLPEHAWRMRRTRLWRRTATVVAAAVLLLFVAGLLQVAALRRQIGAVRAERAEVRSRVAGVLATEALAARTGRQLAELAAAPRQSPRWSVVLETLTRHLPPEAYLTALTGHADTVVVEGNADRSGAVFDALAGAPLLADVRAAAPVRHELRDGEAAAEHFTLAARVTGVVRPPAAPGRAATRTRP